MASTRHRSVFSNVRFSGRLESADYQELLYWFRESRKDRLSMGMEIARHATKLRQLLDEHGGFKWWPLYEFTFTEHAAIGCLLFGWTEQLKRISQAENPKKEFMRFARSDDAELDQFGDWPAEKKAFCVNLVLGMSNSMEAVAYYGCTINELLAKARNGDRMRLLDAMSVDRCALLSTTGTQILAHAQLAQDRRFLNQAFKRMKEPRAKLRKYVDLRVVTRLLGDAGDLAESSAAELKQLIDELNVVSPPGAKELRDQMRRYQKISTT